MSRRPSVLRALVAVAALTLDAALGGCGDGEGDTDGDMSANVTASSSTSPDPELTTGSAAGLAGPVGLVTAADGAVWAPYRRH